MRVVTRLFIVVMIFAVCSMISALGQVASVMHLPASSSHHVAKEQGFVGVNAAHHPVPTQGNYVVVNNDLGGVANSALVYKRLNRSLSLVSTLGSAGQGLGGGYFSIPRISIGVTPLDHCIFVGDAGSSDISAWWSTTPVGTYVANAGYLANLYGLGLVYHSEPGMFGNIQVNGYLYANFTASGVIESFAVAAGDMNYMPCSLIDTGNGATAIGINQGVADGMTTRGNYLAAAYADGSVGMYELGGGAINLKSQKVATGFGVLGVTPTQVYITQNEKYVVADDLGGVASTWDVFPNANGLLAASTTYQPAGAGGGDAQIYGSNTFVASPDETVLYIAGSYSGLLNGNSMIIATDAFNNATGAITATNCGVSTIPGYGTLWEYAGNTALVTNTGKGKGVWQALAGFGVTNASYVAASIADANGCLTYSFTTTNNQSETAFSLQSYSGSPSQ